MPELIEYITEAVEKVTINVGSKNFPQKQSPY
jgi:hypothetical protein